MSAVESPTRDVVFVPETHSNSSRSGSSSTTTESNHEQHHHHHHHHHLSKKPRNYKYWSDDEVKKILNWLTLPENEGKLSRNKAQACREVAKTLFDGDEYMAISVRSKLMSLEKSFREAEQLKLQLSANSKDEGTINDKMKEINKFHQECKQLFSNRTETLTPPSLSSSLNHISTPPTLHSPPPIQHAAITQTVPFSPNTSLHKSSSTLTHRHDYDSSPPPPSSFHNHSDDSILPHLNEDRLRQLSSLPSHLARDTSWLPRAPVDLPPVEDLNNGVTTIERRLSSSERSSVQIARYAAKQASYSAKKAEYEALKSEYEGQKMEYSIQLAEIERERDALAIKKLELELELARSKEASQSC
ncbi:hypothetical protein K501DRAFT_212506 [Backusella circina FSU 941]|nr:hypothetical protein K501DRAFT_212506 [Backusella circina FSU 941]